MRFIQVSETEFVPLEANSNILSLSFTGLALYVYAREEQFRIPIKGKDADLFDIKMFLLTFMYTNDMAMVFPKSKFAKLIMEVDRDRQALKTQYAKMMQEDDNE